MSRGSRARRWSTGGLRFRKARACSTARRSITAHDDLRIKAERLARRNARVIVLPSAEPGRVDLPAMMRWMARHNVNEVHVEAGAGLSGALLSADCVDEILAYIAPVSRAMRPAWSSCPCCRILDGARRFEFVDIHPVGGDVRLRGRFSRSLAGAADCCHASLNSRESFHRRS